MTLQEFINEWLGKECDFDGYYGGQCVDIYRQYVQDVLGFPQSPGVGGATEIWYTASDEYYDFLDNTTEALPQIGDIPIWNRNAGDGFGHVDIVIGEITQTSFLGLDQNFPTLSEVTKTKHNYDNIIGWMRPKGENMDQSECDKRVAEAEKAKNEQIGNLQGQVNGLLKDKERLEKQIADHKCPITPPEEAGGEPELVEITKEYVKDDVKVIEIYTVNRA